MLLCSVSVSNSEDKTDTGLRKALQGSTAADSADSACGVRSVPIRYGMGSGHDLDAAGERPEAGECVGVVDCARPPR